MCHDIAGAVEVDFQPCALKHIDGIAQVVAEYARHARLMVARLEVFHATHAEIVAHVLYAALTARCKEGGPGGSVLAFAVIGAVVQHSARKHLERDVLQHRAARTCRSKHVLLGIAREHDA